MKNSVSVILERIVGSSLYYCVYTLNRPYVQGDSFHFSDNTTLLVTDQKGRNQYLSTFLNEGKKYQYAASGVIRVIEDEEESFFIYNGIESLIAKGGIPHSKVLNNILLLEDGMDLFAEAVSAN